MKKSDNRSGVQKRSSAPPSFQLSQEDLAKLREAQQVLSSLQEKYGLTSDDVRRLAGEGASFPSAIFTRSLTILECVVKYFKEEKQLSLRAIAELIGRDERNVWHMYAEAKKKHAARFSFEEPKFLIPVSILADAALSALEAVVVHLKEEYSLSYHAIALVLKRDDRTVWTVYQRAQRKHGKH